MSDRRIIYSCDLETTGLDHRNCQVLEIAIIAWDMQLPCEPLANMKRFHSYIDHPRIRGEAYALAIHPTILRRIAQREPGWTYTEPVSLAEAVRRWVLEVENGSGEHTDPIPMQFAGKNFGRFDSRFLGDIPFWSDYIKESHRSFDPAILYFDHLADRKLPDMRTCLERAAARTVARTGVDQGFGLLEVTHDAMGDAELVIKLLRAAWGIDEQQPE